MELNIETPKTNGKGKWALLQTKKSRPVKADSIDEFHHSIFNPMKYMLKLPKNKKVTMSNGQVKWEQTESDHLPVAARIAWFRKDHPYWSIVAEE